MYWSFKDDVCVFLFVCFLDVFFLFFITGKQSINGRNLGTPLGSDGYLYKRSECLLSSRWVGIIHGRSHTPSIAFRHLPPNSARFSYATEGAFFISAQLSSDAVRFRRISLESATQVVSDYSLTMPTLLCLYPCYHDPISVSDQGCMYWLHCCIALISWSNCLSIAHAWSVIPYMGSW